MKLAPLKTQASATEAPAPGQPVLTNGTEPDTKPKAKAKGKSQVGCIIPAKTVAALAVLTATAASVLDPANAIVPYSADVFLHAPVEEYSNITALNGSYLVNSSNHCQVFREATSSHMDV